MTEASLNEYFISIKPHTALTERITSVREYFRQQLGISGFLPQPGVLICRFTQLQMAEERIMDKLRLICSENPPFHIAIDGFETRPTHSVMFHLKKNSLEKFTRSLKAAQRLMKYDNDNKPWFAEEPNIVIASSLKPWQYEKAVSLVHGKTFRDSFMAGNICIQKKNSGITSQVRMMPIGEKIKLNQQTLF